jgi:mRNA interferase HigB
MLGSMRCSNASIIDDERVVFNVKGNDYRLVAAIDYERQTVFIKWIGSHKDYDKIDVRKVQYGDQAYQKRSRP